MRITVRTVVPDMATRRPRHRPSASSRRSTRVLLTVGRDASATRLPDYDLLSWTWPSRVYARDTAAWDLSLGSALVMAGMTFFDTGLSAIVRRGVLLNVALCLAGLVAAPFGNMDVRNIGVVGTRSSCPSASW